MFGSNSNIDNKLLQDLINTLLKEPNTESVFSSTKSFYKNLEEVLFDAVENNSVSLILDVLNQAKKLEGIKAQSCNDESLLEIMGDAQLGFDQSIVNAGILAAKAGHVDIINCLSTHFNPINPEDTLSEQFDFFC